MEPRSIQLVLHYDGSAFAGWQRQPDQRTVQGELEQRLSRLCAEHVPAVGAGRTDAGVHARGQAVGVRVPSRWQPAELRRALNALLPADQWVAAAYEMQPSFHARFSAVARRYSYMVGTDDATRSPFRHRWEYGLRRPLDRQLLDEATALLPGEHCCVAFAVRGTAPPHDDHRCRIQLARWVDCAGGLRFEIEANRFLHHMVRFLVGTLLDIATGQRPVSDLHALLTASDNREVSAPAPPHALCLEALTYPLDLYSAAA
jgi:tRNA pseudouridine38-40 synthase